MSATQFPDVTPYNAHLIVNAMLRERDGADAQTLAPQIFYGYAQRGLIESNYKEFKAVGGKGNAQKIVVKFDGESFKSWLDAYLRGEKRSGKTDIASLVSKFSV
jgi:hypothetical protein